MGLNTVKKRQKICQDPNNTAWSRSSSTYGQKILVSQGWSPGLSLGAKDTINSGSPTAINILNNRGNKNYGMGFMSSENCEEDQNTGLDIFQEILGRLNGKPEAQYGIAQQPSKDSKTATLPTRCWQLSHFVSGGFLAGKDSQEYLQETLPVSRSSSKKQFQATEHDALRTTRTPSKKDNASTDKSIILTYGKKRRRTGVSSNQTIIGGPLSQRLSPGRLIITNSLRNVDSITPAIVGIAVVDAHKTQHQLQMEDRKPGRKIKKAIERFPQPKPSQDFLASPAPSIYTDGPIIESPPVPNQPSPDLAQPLNGRHMARQRYITQKKMATKDSKALNEILMIKG